MRLLGKAESSETLSEELNRNEIVQENWAKSVSHRNRNHSHFRIFHLFYHIKFFQNLKLAIAFTDGGKVKQVGGYKSTG